ncbi:MAG: O-acetyl-ADP-ribose deacetylase [Sphaerochaetaceae bacterium]|nr:O-acetyl-ADP-ribose deacetylase [Sphaerochaetaceae bacterium]
MAVDKRMRAIEGDITHCTVDAIVNAANGTLLGGSGVDGAIHRAAGRELLAECMTLGGCETGEAKATKAYRLDARHIIHTVGPIWHGGGQGEARKLASCYRRCLETAVALGDRTIAFPAISTGAYGYPAAEAAMLAVSTVDACLRSYGPETIASVSFVCFDRRTFEMYESVLSNKR